MRKLFSNKGLLDRGLKQTIVYNICF